MVVITGRRRVGILCGHDVWKITSTEVLPFARATRHLTDLQVRILASAVFFQLVTFYSLVCSAIAWFYESHCHNLFLAFSPIAVRACVCVEKLNCHWPKQPL